MIYEEECIALISHLLQKCYWKKNYELIGIILAYK